MNMEKLLKEIKFDDKGLVVTVTQDYKTNEALMVAYMNKESIEMTLMEKQVYYFSRSRNCLWKKGETSGNIQYLKGFYYDCDKDAILLKVKQQGFPCHTGASTCFFNKVYEDGAMECKIANKLYDKIWDRKDNPKEGSYTNYLFNKGLDKILKKVGEEASEVIIGAKNKQKDELIYELSDLYYHILVLMVNEGITIGDVEKELMKRYK